MNSNHQLVNEIFIKGLSIYPTWSWIYTNFEQTGDCVFTRSLVCDTALGWLYTGETTVKSS